MSTDLERIPYWTRQAARQRLTRRRFLGSTAAAGAGLAGAALIGCGGGDGGDGGGGGSDTRGAVTPVPNTSGGAAVGTPTAVAGGGAAQRGGTLRIAGQLTGDVPSLDYDRTNASAMGSIWNLAGAKLTQWDERPDSPGPVEAVIPDLAESWESPDEGLTWTFRLRQDAQTSDGLPVTAEDVVWSFQRQGEIRTPLGLLEANLRDMYPEGQPSATAIDDYTVQIKLLNPDADFLALMGSHWWSVTHESVITKDGSAPGETAPGWGDVTGVDQIRGGGPYYPTEYVPASGFKLARNPNFYDPEIAYFDEIDHPLIVDTTAAAAALQAEQLDAFGPLTQFTVQQGMELEQSENLQVDWQPCMVWNPWVFDMTQPPFNDVRVRRAVGLAVDRTSWIESLHSGRGRNATLVLPWLTYWGLNPDEMGEDGAYYQYDPDEAKKLLMAAGQETFEFQLQTANIGAYTVTYPFADLMASMLSQVGITQQTQIVDYAAHIGGQTFPDRGIYQSFIVRPDIQSYVYAQVGLAGGTVGGRDVWGAVRENDEEYQAFAEVGERQRLTLDREERLEMVHDMQRRMARNMWDFYWPAPDSPVVSNRKVHNFRPPPGWNWNIMKYVWKEA